MQTPKFTRDTPKELFDAIIIGTGPCGGFAAKQLTEGGMKVLVLDAGPMPVVGRDFARHEWPWQQPTRGLAPERRRPDRGGDRLPLMWTNHPDHPFTTDPGKPFSWLRSRIVGGRSLHWARASHRFSDYDFKAGSRDGYGPDWPISYADIAPYYDYVEEHIGVSGYVEGFTQLPDGKFLPGMPYNCTEMIFKRTAQRMGLPVTQRRLAQLTRPHKGRAACHFCGACVQGCDVGAMFNSIVSTLPYAEASNRMTLRPDSIVRSILMGDDGRARGVAYIDRQNKQEYEARAKYIIVAASTLESTRILLNSANGGLANSSGVLGHYLMDQLAGASVTGFFPQMRGAAARHDDGKSSGAFIPNFRNLKEKNPKFIRGYCMSMSGGQTSSPGYALSTPGFGNSLKESIRKNFPAYARIYMSAGEMLARHENHVRIDPDKKDAWGIPVLRISCTHGDNDKALWQDGAEMMKEVFTAAGGEILSMGKNMSVPGGLIHEVGTCRMGTDPKQSVVDQYCRTHDIKNLYVFGGGVFPTTGSYHPTLTMMALTVRGCEHLLRENA